MALISSFTALVAPDVLTCPDPIITREVSSALIEFCKKTQILTKELVFDVSELTIDENIQDAMDLDISASMTNLQPDSIEEIHVDSLDYIAKKREILSTYTHWEYIKESLMKYYWFPDSDTIRIYDMATANSSVYCKLVCKPTRTTSTVDDRLFEDWSEAIAAGAKYKILAMPGKEWTDPQAAQFYRSLWRKYLSEAKSETLRNAPGEMHQVNPVDFETGVT